MSPRNLLEVAVLCLGMVAACSLAFGTPTSEAENLLPALLYAPIPMIIWAALRFRSLGASGAIFVVTVLALWHEMQGHGPFVDRGPEPSVLPLQLFLAAISTPVLFLSALIEELRRTNDRLGSVLSGIPPELLFHSRSPLALHGDQLQGCRLGRGPFARRDHWARIRGDNRDRSRTNRPLVDTPRSR